MATATGDTEEMDITDVDEDQRNKKDEFIVDVDKVRLIAEVQDKLHDIFQVTFTYGDLCEDADIGNKQWIEVEGREEDRRSAKEYIRALCNPVDVQPMRYPEELEVVLTSAGICERVEKQSRAVLRFEQPGEVLIYGNDRLSVTLAYSALEDVISEHLEFTSGMEEAGTPIQTAGSSRLDEELKRRLSTENGNTMDEDLPSLSNVIKRTILDVLNTGNKKHSDRGGFDVYGIKPHTKVDATQTASSSQSGFIDIRSPKRSERPSASSSSLGDAAKQLKQIQINCDDTNSSSNNNGGKEAVVSSDVSTGGSEEGKYLKNFALEKGYTDEQIEQVFAKHGRNVTFEDFYRSLTLNDMDTNTTQPSTSKVLSPPKSDSSSAATSGKSEKQDKTLSTKQVASYIARLSKDHEEEDKVKNIEELKLRNYERQRLLMEIFEKRKGQKEGTEDETESSRENSAEPVIDLTEDVPDAPTKHRVQDQNYRQQAQENLLNYHQRRSPTSRPKGVHRSRSPQHDPVRSSFMHGRSPSPKRLRAMQANKSPVHQQPAPSRVQHSYQNTTTSKPVLGSRSNLRYIIIDGSNAAMAHGNGKVFSCRGIQLCVDYFLKRGHLEVTAFVPQWRTRTSNPDSPISDQHLLDELKQQGNLVFTPARRVPGKNIVPYDDRYVIRLSEETDGVIVSNDNYRDLWHEKREWRHIIENRLLMYSFVGDIFMPPDDPLGKDGPTLTQFLTKGDWRLPAGANVNSRTNFNRPHNMLPPYQQQQHQQYSHQQYQHTGKHFQQQQQQQQQHFQPFQSQDAVPRAKNSAWRPGNQNYRPYFQGADIMQHPTGFNPGHRQGFINNQGAPQKRGGGGRQQGIDFVDLNTSESQPNQSAPNQTQDSVDGSGWKKVPYRQNRPQDSNVPKRNSATTEQLLEQLRNVFDNDDAIQTILMENSSETDLNILSEYYLNYTDSN